MIRHFDMKSVQAELFVYCNKKPSPKTGQWILKKKERKYLTSYTAKLTCTGANGCGVNVCCFEIYLFISIKKNIIPYLIQL